MHVFFSHVPICMVWFFMVLQSVFIYIFFYLLYLLWFASFVSKRGGRNITVAAGQLD